MVSKALKARYYPKIDILKATLGRRPSYLWRSIYSCGLIIKICTCWIIDNENNANIWEDIWLPNLCRFKLLTHKPSVPKANGVRDLIDKEKVYWESNNINNMFIPLDRDNILNIPLHKLDEDDTLSWTDNKDANYNVKSGYYSLKD